MSITWTETLDNIDWEWLSHLYAIAPLGNKSADWLQESFANSRYVCFAWSDGRVIAAGRAVADGCDVSYIGDVAVHPDFQGQGLGKQIVQTLIDRSKGHRKILLYANPGKEGFYERFGFRRMKTAMAIFENEQWAIENGMLE
ncbi:GNAT family N-acetyltransferase [Rubinisphaera sp. JC750]|uniref:GNAT family N-acetyltransferase n=1 Tax=Rubinisphaera sp. JC750 TaxID=2898658 RepID=UPI001F240A58|nr:GNAT family N-acetyltransferase [Rubinisphaera sp. JC750]